MQFNSPEFLTQHSQSILDFYDKRVVDKTGGFYQNFYDNGELFKPEYHDIAKHGLNYVEQVHWQEDSQTYAWTLENHQPVDMTQQAYGYAFVLLAYSAAKKANIITSDEPLLKVYQLLEQRFWQKD